MNGITALNFQNDSDAKRRKISDETSIDFSGPDAESLTRQEMGPDTDINRMLNRFGVGPAPKYGQFDDSIDLQSALHAIRDAKIAHSRIPQGLREKYPTWQSLLNALETGQLTLDMSPAEPEVSIDATQDEDSRVTRREVRRNVQLRDDDDDLEQPKGRSAANQPARGNRNDQGD